MLTRFFLASLKEWLATNIKKENFICPFWAEFTDSQKSRHADYYKQNQVGRAEKITG